MSGLLWVLAGCPRPADPPVPEPAPAPAPAPRRGTLQFEPAPSSPDLALSTQPIVSRRAVVDGVEVEVAYRVLARTGTGEFGTVPALAGTPSQAPAEPCPHQDFNGLLPVGSGAALVSHFECTPGSIWITRLQIEPDGLLTPQDMAPVSWEDWKGLWFPCAGMVSPWGTHLGSEEYEPNAVLTSPRGPYEKVAWENMTAYLGGDERAVEPYRYGWTTEVVIPEQGAPVAAKHFALGRLSHELSYVLPDQRTVIQSDDGTAVGLFLFVADRPADLSAGTLYAAKFEAPRDGGGEIPLTWISLGHADHPTIARAIDQKITFQDLFERTEPEVGAEGGPRCPEGFRYVNHHYGQECLKLREPSETVPDPGLLASRLETRRYAAWLGASTELEKAEGVTFDPETGKVFLALSSIARRSLAEPGQPDDHLQLPPNPCGMVVGLQTASHALDSEGRPIGSEQVPISMAPEVVGAEVSGEKDRCDPASIANPDNLTFLPGYGLLMIAEDTHRHDHAALWAWSVRERALTPVLFAPQGGEITGIHWIPDLHGHGYLTLAIQHPWEVPEDVARPPGLTPEDLRGFTGYIGPFPSLRWP